MTDQLVSWLGHADAVLLAATPVLKHLAALLEVLAEVVTAWLTLKGTLWLAARSRARSVRPMLKGKQTRLTRPVSDRPA